MRAPAVLRKRGERGGTTLEMAIVAPLVFTLIATAAVMGIDELGNSVGAAAARDGARQGVLAYANADNTSTADYASIVSAVQARLGSAVLGTPSVAVSCVHPDGTAVGGTGTCDPSQVVAGTDAIQVAVTWTQRGSSAFQSASTRTDTSRMTIAGTPPTSVGSSQSGVCTLAAQAAAPSTVLLGGTELNQDVDITVTESSAGACGLPTVTAQFSDYGTSGVAQPMALQSGTTYTYTYYHDVGTWTTGTKTVQVSAGSASPVLASFLVSPTPPPCTLVVSPLAGNVSINGNGTVKNNGDLLITATVSGPECGAPTIVVIPAKTGGLDTVTAMNPHGTNSYTFDVGVDAQSSNPWTSGLKTATVNAIGASVAVRITVG